MYHVAAETRMPGVTGEMIDWWFGYVTTTQQYKQWHPADHISSTWSGPHGNSTYIGGHHLVQEKLHNGPVQKLRISFKSPSEYFGPNWKADFERAGVATAICARVGLWSGIGKAGIDSGHVIHLVMKEKDGVRMRSRFWLGDISILPPIAALRAAAIDESIPKGLQIHCSEEMTYLAGFLPELYKKENALKAKL